MKKIKIKKEKKKYSDIEPSTGGEVEFPFCDFFPGNEIFLLLLLLLWLIEMKTV